MTGSSYYTIAYTPTNRNWDGQHRNHQGGDSPPPGYSTPIPSMATAPAAANRLSQSHSAALQRRKSNGARKRPIRSNFSQPQPAGRPSAEESPWSAVHSAGRRLQASMQPWSHPAHCKSSSPPASPPATPGSPKLEKGAPTSARKTTCTHPEYNTRPFRNEQLRSTPSIPATASSAASLAGRPPPRTRRVHRSRLSIDMGEPVNSFLSNVQSSIWTTPPTVVS